MAATHSTTGSSDNDKKSSPIPIKKTPLIDEMYKIADEIKQNPHVLSKANIESYKKSIYLSLKKIYGEQGSEFHHVGWKASDDKKRTPLMIGGMIGIPEIIEALLKLENNISKHKIRERDSNGYTALAHAISYPDADEKIDSKDSTLSRRRETIGLLLSKCNNELQEDTRSRLYDSGSFLLQTNLYVACLHGNLHFIKNHIKKYADTFQVYHFKAHISFYLGVALRSNSMNHQPVISYLLTLIKTSTIDYNRVLKVMLNRGNGDETHKNLTNGLKVFAALEPDALWELERAINNSQITKADTEFLTKIIKELDTTNTTKTEAKQAASISAASAPPAKEIEGQPYDHAAFANAPVPQIPATQYQATAASPPPYVPSVSPTPTIPSQLTAAAPLQYTPAVASPSPYAPSASTPAIPATFNLHSEHTVTENSSLIDNKKEHPAINPDNALHSDLTPLSSSVSAAAAEAIIPDDQNADINTARAPANPESAPSANNIKQHSTTKRVLITVGGGGKALKKKISAPKVEDNKTVSDSKDSKLTRHTELDLAPAASASAPVTIPIQQENQAARVNNPPIPVVAPHLSVFQQQNRSTQTQTVSDQTSNAQPEGEENVAAKLECILGIIKHAEQLKKLNETDTAENFLQIAGQSLITLGNRMTNQQPKVNLESERKKTQDKPPPNFSTT